MAFGKKETLAQAKQRIADGKAKWSNGLSDQAVPAGIAAGLHNGKILSDSLYWRQYNTTIKGIEGAYYVKVDVSGKIVYVKATEQISNQLKENLPVKVEIRLNVPIMGDDGVERKFSFAGFPANEESTKSPQQTVSTEDMKKAILKAKIKAGQNVTAAKAEIEAMAPDELELEYLTL